MMKRKDPPGGAKESQGRQPNPRNNKRVKVQDARNIRTQPSDAALEDGKLDLNKFLNAREFEIKALEKSMTKCKAINATRVFQMVPRAMRRRTASHNVKRVPKRLRAQARKEMLDDNTPTVESRKRKPRTTRARIRAETMKKLRYLADKKKKKKAEKSGDGTAEDAQTKAKGVVTTRAPRPKIRRNMLNEPPKADSKFRKRQINKTWLPTHLWHAKRATMTKPNSPLWRFAIPLTSTAKCYRPTHRASGQKGVVAWDVSYMSTIGVYGTDDCIERVLRSLGLVQEGLWNARGKKWRTGVRKWTGTVSRQQKSSRRDMGPTTIVWNPEPPATNSDEMETSNRSKKSQRQILIRTHPSCFLELFDEVVKLAKRQKPQPHVEDLRFEIGSIELLGPGSTETLLGILEPYHETPETAECHASVFRSLAGVTNPASLPKDAVLAFSAKDPRLAYPPKRIQIPNGGEQTLLKTLTEWQVEENLKPYNIFDRESRYQASRMPSQKSVNRRKGANAPGEPIKVTAADPPIPVLLLASRPATDGQAQGTWTLLAPWKCIQALWYCLMHYPLTTGGNPRLGGLEEQRQIAFEHGTPWFPGDFPATNAGVNWELEQRAKRRRDWDRRPKSKRLEWKSLDLGAGRKGEIGDGLACDFEHLLGLPKSDVPRTQEKSGAVSIPDPAAEAMVLDPPEPAESGGTQGPSQSPLSRVETISLVTKTAFNALAKSASAEQPPAGSIVTVSLAFVTRGVAKPCARIYRLPSKPKTTVVPSTQTEVPATPEAPSSALGSLPADLREQWLAKVPLASSNANKINKRGPAAAPRMPAGVDMETRKKILTQSLLTTELAYPKSAANQADFGGHPLCPNEEDLIGFVTTGAFSLSEGKATAIGSISAERAVETLRETGVREGKFCIVRNAGESVGWLARWELV
ncbi:ribonucleases P/MRP protein subunit POP1-domain-containing protein [Apiosordaria backusii]|uniref:Ribonucleases P/MRP protein subunit POP1-domain-containing protein n=1 Tax=Apiosordaria backusii TaxID=314023 RepID=A0AA40AMY0_9PEZI|nr:ribonucleases P/MRP protein subunit POP1-domain-containing protein [Apiosordaria backusii]